MAGRRKELEELPKFIEKLQERRLAGIAQLFYNGRAERGLKMG
jgi:hypothetical protein